MTLLLAIGSAFAFACGMIASNVGLRHMSAWSGVTVSVPSTTLLFWLTLPWLVEPSGARLSAVAIFLLVGLFFPAAVTLLVFQANRRLGPTLAATLSCTAPLFAVAAAVAVLGETLDLHGAAATVAVVLGVILLSTASGAGTAGGGLAPASGAKAMDAAALALALAPAALRAAAQVLLKIGFAAWASPLAAILAGYAMSSAVLLVCVRLLAARWPVVRNRRGMPWFVLAGACNGAGMLAMYAALVDGAVSMVAPIVASYPVFTLLLSALLLGEERFPPRQLWGVLATVAGVAALAAR